MSDIYRKLTPSQENYLEHILTMSTSGDVRVRDLANAVGVKLPSVTRAIRKLADVGMVRHENYGSIEITAAGKNAARSVKRRDDCLMRFLVEVLELPADRAKSEACRIEHVISEDVLKRLEILVTHLSDAKEFKKRLQQQLNELDDIEEMTVSTKVGQTRPHA